MTDGVKISVLTLLPAFTGRERIPVALDGGNYGATPAQLLDYLQAAGFNRVPVAADQIATAFDTAQFLNGNLLTGASDGDGDTVAIGQVTYGGTNVQIGAAFQALYGVFFVSGNGDWSYTLGSSARALTTGDVEHEIFTFVASDGRGGISTKHLTVTITGTNSAPIVSYVNGETPVNQVLAGNLIYRLAFDPETSVSIASYTIAGVGGTQAVGGNVTISGVGTINIAVDGDYTFTPLTGFVGPAPLITYLVTDGVNYVPGYLTIAVNPSIAGSQPIVLFTDVPSAPVDDGTGVAAGGAVLHIHGVRLGDPSGLGTTTRVFIGGIEVGTYVAMDTDPYAKPGFGRQRIAVRVGALGGATLGQPLHVKVVTGGQESNTDAVFTPNPGRILYVAQDGNDSTAVYGDPTHPWRYLQTTDRHGAYGAARAGDQIVVRAGIGGASWTDTGYSTAWLRFRDAAQQGSNPTGAAGTGWISIVGYPGEVVKYQTAAGTKGGIQGPGQDVTGVTGDFVSISNLRIAVSGGATRDAGPVNMQYNAQNCRVVGCELGPWVAGDSAVLNCAGVSGQGNFFKILGCHIHSIEGTSALQNHGVYPGTNSYGWEIAYNWIHDISGGSHLSFNDSDGGTGTFETPFGVWQGFTNISVHHNWFENAAKYCLSFNDVGAQQGQLDFRFTCNMVIGTGLPPFHFGTTTTTSDGLVAFNTIYNCNVTPSGGNAMVRNDGWQQTPGRSIKFYDNIFAFGPGTVVGTGWLNDTTGFSNGITWSRNLYWVNGDTTAPSPTMDSLAVIGNPQFTNAGSGDFTLQSSSPAVNAATQALPAGVLVLDDYTGQIPRFAGGGPDLGCFEYASPAPYIITPPHFTGGPQVTTLTSATFGSWANSPSSLSGQFRLGGTPDGSAIPGPGPGTITFVAGDERQHAFFDITATNGSGSTVYTLDLGIVAVGPGAPVNTALPVVSGPLAAGTTSNLSDGTWTGASHGFAYDWLHDSTVIVGETANAYLKVAGDVGHMITGRVYALDPVNGAQLVASVAVGPITPAPADPVVVQSVAHSLTASTNQAFTFPGAVASGDLVLIFLAEWDNAPFNSHFSDTQGHVTSDMTRTTATLYNSTNPWIGWAYVKTNAAAGAGAYTMTVNPDSGQGGAAVAMHITGLDPTTVQDIPPDNNQGLGTAITLTATAATTQAKDQVCVGVGVVGIGHTITGYGPDWELVDHADGLYNGAWVFQRKESAVETFTFSATIDASTGWIAQSFVVKGST